MWQDAFCICSKLKNTISVAKQRTYESRPEYSVEGENTPCEYMLKALSRWGSGICGGEGSAKQCKGGKPEGGLLLGTCPL